MRFTRVTNQLRAEHSSGSSRLRVVEGPDVGLEVTIPPVGVVVGADPANDVTLNDEAVSGRHCTVVPSEGGFKVRDLESRNGTFLDDLALSEAVVPVGGVLRLGRTLLQLMPGEDVVDIPPSQRTSFGELHGNSPAMRQVFALLERAASSDASVLFIGESGTGKELASRAIHENSPRREGPFVVFDCGAASETLIASDLFGHAKGAFTGANDARAGAFAEAHGGTLFLDEIGDLPLDLQPKLLRLLERGEVTALGTNEAKRYDVRVVAATHRNLWEEVCSGTFRGDLYYRLAVLEVHLPPLRAHKDDIPALVEKFLEPSATMRFSGGGALEADQGERGKTREGETPRKGPRKGPKGRPRGPITGPNLNRLMTYHWPGNVRELRNVVQRAVALSPPGAPFSEMPILLRPSAPAQETGPVYTADRPFRDVKAEVVERFERAYLTDLLRRAQGNLSEAARLSGLERKYLYTILDKYGLRKRR